MKQLLKREAEAQKAGGGEVDGGNVGGGAPGASACFADALLEQAGGDLAAWASKNRGAFVVAALEEVPSSRLGVREVLGATPAKARLIKEANNGSSMGAKVGGSCRCLWASRVL